MAINYIKGEMLEADLIRSTNLSFDGGTLYLDVGSNRVGVNTQTPTEALDVIGNAKVSNGISADTATLTSFLQAGNVYIDTNTITTNSGDLILTSASSYVSVPVDLKFDSVTGNITGVGDSNDANAQPAVTVATSFVDVPYYLGNISTNTQLGSFSAIAAANGFYLTADGFTIFYVDSSGGGTADVDVYQTTLGTAFLLSTAGVATFTNVSVAGQTETEAAHGITFNPNGLEMYISKYTNTGIDTRVEKYTLSVAFDLTSTITHISDTLYVAGDQYNFAPSFSSDGLKTYIVGIDAVGTYIHEYDISPAYNLAAPVFNGLIEITTELTHASNYISVEISADGTEVFAAQFNGTANKLASYTLGTAHDISTAVSNEIVTPGTSGEARRIWFPTDGFNLYWLGDDGIMYQYDSKSISPNSTSAALNFDGLEKLITTADGVQVSGQLVFPSYTTATLPAPGAEGGTVYDSTTKTLKYFDGTNWSGTGALTGVNMYVLTAATTDATITEALDASSNPLDLADNTTWRFEANIVARRTDAGGVESSGYKFTGVIARDTGTASIVGIVAETIDAEDDATWSVTVDANVNSLRVQVTGAAKDISWVVFVRTVEVSD